MSGQQTDAEDRETGDGDVDEAVEPGDASEGEDRAGEHPGAGARGTRQQTVETNGQARDREEVGLIFLLIFLILILLFLILILQQIPILQFPILQIPYPSNPYPSYFWFISFCLLIFLLTLTL